MIPTLEDRLRVELGNLMLQLIALRFERDQLRAELNARPASPADGVKN